MAELSKSDWGQRSFDAGKRWRLSGGYYSSGVADARVVHYGFTKWLNEFPPGTPPRGITKAYLERSFREGYSAGKRVERKDNPSGSTGIKFILGITGTGANRVSETQSVLFSKDYGWTVSRARAWLRGHGYRVTTVDEGKDYLRFRQSDPKKYKTFRTIEAGARNPAGDTEDHLATSLAHRLYPHVAEGVSSEGKLQEEIHGALHGERVKNPGLPARFKRGVGGFYSLVGLNDADRARALAANDKLSRQHAAQIEREYKQAMRDYPGADPEETPPGKPFRKRWRNPDGTSTGLYEEFHGEAPSSTTEFREEEEYRDDLSELGTLVEIIVDTVTGLRATIQFDGNAPKLSASPDGKQLYFIGGNQALDLDKLKLGGDKWLRDLMLIGDWDEVTYRTAKGFDNFKLSDYYHNLGEESGYRPVIVYDTLNKRMQSAGGKSHITSRGIED